MAKATENIVLKRVASVSEQLINGTNSDCIVQYCAVNWGIAERQTYKYIQKAKELIEDSVKRNVNYDYAKAILRYEDLYKKAIDASDYRAAAQINKELASLQGLYKLQVEHSGSVQFICNIPD